MQKLHLVGFTTDQAGLILSARRGARSGGYTLVLDEALAQAVEDLRARLEEESDSAGRPSRSDRTESRLPVSEIQARLRRGKSLKDVAKEAGVDPEWVERFAAPVFAEQAETIARVQSTYLRRARLGPSGVRIGDAVRRNLAERGVTMTPDDFTQSWTTHQRADGRWIVRFTFSYRGSSRVLKYEVPASGEVTAADPFTSQLSYITPPKRATPRPKPAPAPSEPAAAKRAVVSTGFRPDPLPKAVSRPGKEREKAAAAMNKAAARGAIEAERAAARKARERSQLMARREREARIEAQKRERLMAARAREAAAAARLAAAEQAERDKRAAAEAEARRLEREQAREAARRKAQARSKVAAAKRAAAKQAEPAKRAAPAKKAASAGKAAPVKATPAKRSPAKRPPRPSPRDRVEPDRPRTRAERAARLERAAGRATPTTPATPATASASTAPATPIAPTTRTTPPRPRPEQRVAAAPPRAKAAPERRTVPTARPVRDPDPTSARTTAVAPEPEPPVRSRASSGLAGAAVDVYGPEATRALFRAGLAQPAADPATEPTPAVRAESAASPEPVASVESVEANGASARRRPPGLRRTRPLRAR